MDSTPDTTLLQTQTPTPTTAITTTTSATRAAKHFTYDQLERDVRHLQTSMEILHELVEIQQEPLDTIEQAIADSRQAIQQGQVSLETTEEWSSWSSSVTYGLSVFAVVVYLLL